MRRVEVVVTAALLSLHLGCSDSDPSDSRDGADAVVLGNDVVSQNEKRSSVAFAFFNEPALRAPVVIDLPDEASLVRSTWVIYSATGSDIGADQSRISVWAQFEGTEGSIGPRVKVTLSPGGWNAESGTVSLQRAEGGATLDLTGIVLRSQDGRTMGPISGTIQGDEDTTWLCGTKGSVTDGGRFQSWAEQQANEMECSRK